MFNDLSRQKKVHCNPKHCIVKRYQEARFNQPFRKMNESFLNCYELCISVGFSTGMHNIRPAGQMWPAETFDLAREALIFVYLACFFMKTPFLSVKTCKIWPLNTSKKIFGPSWDLSCAPLL